MKQLLDRPEGKIVLGTAVVALIAIFAGVFYVFGGNGARTSTTGAVTAPTLVPTGSGKVFTIDSSGTEASFTIDEVLFGQQNTVVGTTSQVAGQIQVDKDDPSKSQVGQIKVDLTGLTTDSNLRNNTIQGRILETGDSSNQFAVFTPKSISGLPESVTVGQAFSFKITGDLDHPRRDALGHLRHDGDAGERQQAHWAGADDDQVQGLRHQHPRCAVGERRLGYRQARAELHRALVIAQIAVLSAIRGTYLADIG